MDTHETRQKLAIMTAHRPLLCRLQPPFPWPPPSLASGTPGPGGARPFSALATVLRRANLAEPPATRGGSRPRHHWHPPAAGAEEAGTLLAPALRHDSLLHWQTPSTRDVGHTDSRRFRFFFCGKSLHVQRVTPRIAAYYVRRVMCPRLRSQMLTLGASPAAGSSRSFPSTNSRAASRASTAPSSTDCPVS